MLYLVLLLTSCVSHAASYQAHKFNENTLAIQSDKYQLTLKALASGAIEVNYLNLNSTEFPSFSVAPDVINSSNPSLTNSDFALHFKTDVLTAVVNKQDLQIRFYKGKQLLLAEEAGYFHTDTVRGFRFKLAKGEQLMGTGERVLGMDRRGHRLPLYNRAHYGYETESTQMNFSIPAIMSDKKYILLFDNTAKGWIDLGASEPDILQFEAVAGRTSYIVFAGDTYPELLNQYVDVTGKQPLPPRWAFGNHASRFGYKSQQQVLDTIALYRQLNIPVDSIILDLYWFGKDIQGHMGNLDWDKTTFPDPIQMIDTLQKQGVKTVLISEPFILTTSKRWQQAVGANALAKNIAGNKAKTFDFFFGNTGLVDVFHEDGQKWFGNIYQNLAKQGVAGVWGDLGEPEVHPSDMLHTISLPGSSELPATSDEIHNAYGHQWGRLVDDSLREVQPNTRPFMIMRAGFSGSQRYGMLPWTGDVSRSWGGLKPQVELSLQMSLLGLSYTHSDLGGFAGDNYDKELYIRWLQYGVFQPIYRPHAQDAVPPEPVFHDKETQDIIREYINLRYQLLPYNYTLAYENSKTGMPLMRPMFFENENNSALIPINDQYLWGDSFLVKPITDPNLTSVKVRLPKGNWFNYWSGEKYQGEQEIDFSVDLTTIPVLVRAGAIIPSIDTIQTIDDYGTTSLTLDYYFDPTLPSSNALLYDDDGISRDSLVSNKHQLLRFTASNKSDDKLLIFSLENTTPNQGYTGMPESRSIALNVKNWRKSVNQVLLNGRLLKVTTSKANFEQSNHGVWFDKQSKQLRVKFDWLGQQNDIQLEID
ncbi:MAG: glycoside hydrolase family 31 protein [Gammaproteobacteria bacterium]|nr:glycoside hydrolase family 31 protein [Gammaproteobacteria bacterium]